MLVAWLVWLVPLAGALLVPISNLIDRRACRWVAMAVSGVAASLGLYQAISFSQPYVEGLGGWSVYRGVLAEVKVDGLSVLLTAFVSLISFTIVVYAAGNMRKEAGQARFYSLILVFVGAMLALVMAGSLIQLYIFWEVVGICSALLIAFWTDRESARRAGFKAFLVTRIGDISLLIAVILILTSLGTTDLDHVNAAVQTGSLNWELVGLLFLIGAMGKSAQVPLHVWLPDAMEGPTPVSALIHAATMVNAGVYLLVRMSPVIAYSSLVSSSVLVVGLTSLLVGAACASAAEDLKRVLAYSTISQLGLMFAAIGLGAWSGATYHLISQGLFKALAFMAAGSVIEAVGSRNISDMGGLARSMKYTYLAFLFSTLAMAGLPPLIGFWTKDEILGAATSGGVLPGLVMVIGFALTSFYGFRVLFRVFHGPFRPSSASESGWLMLLPMMFLVALVAFGWLGLGYQSLLLPPLSEALSALTSAASLGAMLLGLGVSYAAFLVRPAWTEALLRRSLPLSRTKAFLLEGLGFDRLYSYLTTSGIRLLTRFATAIQTGDLRYNVALLFSIIILLLLLAASGVL
ncbi:MAG: NADH-quinone oxidoreductase subunit L [Thaumarchaeota archaeon]|nr:NADH-quinone oxidoreductase subunit L [Nitrososphaerota archaeon]